MHAGCGLASAAKTTCWLFEFSNFTEIVLLRAELCTSNCVFALLVFIFFGLMVTDFLHMQQDTA